MGQSVSISLLNFIERCGNRLPPPAVLFLFLAALVALVSSILEYLGVSTTHPVTKAPIEIRGLLSGDGIQYALTHTVTNFTQFAPVGTVLVAMMGLGIADRSGLLTSVLTRMVRTLPNSTLSAGVVFAGVMSSLGADSGYVILIPLAGVLFASAGKHPIAGMAAAFAGVSGGYGANLLVGPVDVILAGLSTEAAKLVEPEAEVGVLANYLFMIASTLLVTAIGALVTERVIIPKLGTWSAVDSTPKETDTRLSLTTERRALRISLVALLFMLGALILAVIPEQSPLRNPTTGAITQSPLMSGIVVLISLLAAITGLIFGFVNRRYRQWSAVVEDLEASMATMAGYLVLMFFAAQFINYFAWSNMGLVLAINSANVLEQWSLPGPLLMVTFVLVVAGINLTIGSASAKWSLLAPVFVPMFLLLGISPEQTQAAYRIGDSSTNIITPLMPYFGVVYAFMQQYLPRLGVGTLISLMLPYSFSFLLLWSLMLAAWLGLGLPLGF